jgi:hypothetical protein
MKTTSTLCMMALMVVGTSILCLAKSHDQDGWSDLSKITHKHRFTVETRDHRCISGRIIEIAPDHIALSDSSHSPAGRISPRAEVLQVMSGGIVYYSGRSSWSDISAFRLMPRKRLLVVTTVGHRSTVTPPYTISDEGITLYASGKQTIPKREIAQVYDLVEKPFSDFGEYALGELGPLVIFDPDWYVWKLHLQQRVPVLLYDASKPEDNSPMHCASK